MRLALLGLAPILTVMLAHCGESDTQSPSGADAATTPTATTTATTPVPTTTVVPPPVDASADVVVPTDASTDSGADAAVRYVPSYKALNHALCTGQSLSVGSKGTPVLSTTQPYDNKMFNTGVRVAGGTNLTSFVPLVEAGLETMSSAFASLVTRDAQTLFQDLAAPADSHRLLVSCHGIGGTAYVGLKKGTAAYQNGIAQVTAAKALAAAAGQSYVVRVVTNVHGESDHVAKNAAYKDNLLTWQSDYDTDVKAITGQADSVIMLHTQMSSWTKYNSTTSTIPMQQLDATLASNGKIAMVGPKYNIEYDADGVHLTTAGYRHMGEYYAKAYRQIILEGRPWEPLRPLTITKAGAVIRVKFLVPKPPLMFDTVRVTDPGNLGFEFTEDGAAPAVISQVALEGTDTVKITLSKAPSGANAKVRYAFTGVSGQRAGATTGPRGNLRDSDTSTSRYGYSLFNWAVHFELPVP